MSVRAVLLLALTVLTTILSGCDKHAQDRIAIRSLTHHLVDAINGHNGDAYADLLSSDTVDYNTRTLKLILTGKKADIQDLPFHQRYEILLVRSIGRKKDLKELDGKGYAAWIVSNGAFDYMPGPGHDLVPKDLIFRKDEAYLNFVDDSDPSTRMGRRRQLGSATSYTYRFVLEENLWKFDQTTFMQAFDNEISVAIKQAGVDENLAIVRVLSNVLGREVPSTVWSSMP